MKLPKRTGGTPLTDAELLLFDFMFDGHVAFHLLTEGAYSSHMNCSYSHGLSDEALRKTLASLTERGLVRASVGEVWSVPRREFQQGELFTMTEAGGALWERERLPDWDRFVATEHSEPQFHGRGMLRVTALSEKIGRLCMGAMFASGQFAPMGEIRVRTVSNVRLLPWKSFARVQSIRCKTGDSTYDLSNHIIECEVYEAARCWWRDAQELDALNSTSQ